MISTHTVTFIDWNGTVLKTEIVEHGRSAIAPQNPKREGYNFIGWDVDFSSITNDELSATLHSLLEVAHKDLVALGWNPDPTILNLFYIPS